MYVGTYMVVISTVLYRFVQTLDSWDGNPVSETSARQLMFCEASLGLEWVDGKIAHFSLQIYQ